MSFPTTLLPSLIFTAVAHQLWTRVWDPAEEDFAAGRIYAGDPKSDEPEYVSDREDLEPLFQER